MNNLIDIRELSKHLSVAVGTLYNWASAGKVPYKKVGRCLRFDVTEVESAVIRTKLVKTSKGL